MFGITVTEKEIPVPWGHISAKIWGDEKDVPVLVIHGIMDNAGSFDRLIPLLPKSFYYICIDLPGHGLSSHFPAHLPVVTISHIIVYKLLADYFNRKRYIIMGHSYGGQLGFLFAQLYPQSVEKLIMLDTAALIPVETRQFKNYLKDKLDHHLVYEEKISSSKGPPTYTYDEALDKIQLGRFSPITFESALALSHRSLRPAENGRYTFTLDQRMKNFINPLRDFKYLLQTFKEFPVSCPVLIVLGRHSKIQLKYMKSVIAYLRKTKNVTIKMVDGHHDVHNDSPELVAPYIHSFLLRRKGKL